MPSLRVQLFGCPRVSHDGVTWTRQATRAADLLLAMLVLQGSRLQARERLSTQIWPEATPDQARGALRTTLWRLRKVLEPDGVVKGTFLKLNGAGELGLNWESGLRCDTTTFETQICRSLATPDLAQNMPELLALETALELCPAPLMEAFYDDWLIVERERLIGLRSDALIALMETAVERCDWRRVRTLGQRILADDPLRESVHRTIILANVRMGQWTQALRQYQRCAALLRKELDVAPMPETRALLAEVIQARGDAMTAMTEQNDLRAALSGMDRALRQLRDVRRHLVPPLPSGIGPASHDH